MEEFLASLQGKDVEMRVTETHIQWRHVGEEWLNLMPIEEMTEAAARAESYANLAKSYKQDAESAKTDALTAKDDAESARDTAVIAKSVAEEYATGLASPQVVVTTLAPGTPNTAEWDTSTSPPTLRLGISRGQDGLGAGDMIAALYDTDNDGVVNRADVADALDSSATIDMSQVDGLSDALGGKASSTHHHAISDITNLQDTLNGKAALSHEHAISNVTGLQAALDGKASPATQIIITIPSANWTGSSAPYTATITVEGITATSKGDIALSNEADAEEREAARNAMISVVGLDEDEITLVADGEKPTIDIPAVVTVLG